MSGMAPAQAVPVGPLSVDTSTISLVTTSECVEVPITFYLATAPADVEDWVVDGDIVDAAGASRASVFEYETVPVTQTTSTYTMCGLAMGTNTFTLAVDLRAYGSSDSYYQGRYLKTFHLVRNAPAPPPEPEKEKSRLELGRASIVPMGNYAQVVLPVTVKGCLERRALVIRGDRGGSAARWAKIKAVRVSKRVVIRAKVPDRFVRVRAYLAEGQDCLGAISTPIRMPRARG